MAETDDPKSNGFGHMMAIISIGLAIAGVLVTIMLSVLSGIGARIDDVRKTTLSLREHEQFLRSQEAAVTHNQTKIDDLFTKMFELQRQVDRANCK